MNDEQDTGRGRVHSVVQLGCPEMMWAKHPFLALADRAQREQDYQIRIPIKSNSMILAVFTLTLEPVNPLQFSIDELRSFFSNKAADYTRSHKDLPPRVIHRYPVVQCKQVKSLLMVIGICQGAVLLKEISDNRKEIRVGEMVCTISGRDEGIRNESFGISDVLRTYEFLTPWLALNQQNAKKFYDLKGKPDRDAFMQKILHSNLITLAKSIDYDPNGNLISESRVRFRHQRIHQENVMVFLGTFTTNLRIPDYLGIGQSISQGFGTIRSLSDNSGNDNGKTAGTDCIR